nr:immunoglobulin light chain junction region [Macaca mulatta]
CLQHKNYPLTL